MLYFLYGEDTYRSRQKLTEILRAFQEKSGGALGVFQVDAAESPELLAEIGRTASLFSPKELAVIERSAAAKGEWRAYLESRLPLWAEDRDLTVVFWDESANERSRHFFEKIKKRAAKAQEFKFLSGQPLLRWVGAEAARRNARLGQGDALSLAGRHGGDLWALANELDKVAAGASVRRADAEAVKVWDFTDAFLSARTKAFRPFDRLLASGEDPIYLLASLAGALRNFVRVFAASARRRAEVPGIRDFIVRKYLALAAHSTAEGVAETFADLTRTDAALKTGALPGALPILKLILGGVRGNKKQPR